MTRNLTIIIIIIFAFISCSEKKKEVKSEKSNKIEEKVPEILLNDISLEYSFLPGDSFDYKLSTITNNTQSLNTDTTLQSGASQSLYYTFNVDVISKKKDDYTLKINIEDVTLSGNVNGMPIEYKSSAQNPAELKKQFVEYEAISNAPFQIVLSNKGDIKSVSGVEKIVNNLLSINGNTNISINERLGLIKNVKESMVKPLSQQIFRELPKDKVNKDSTWTYNYPSIPLAVFEVTNKAMFRVGTYEKFASDTLLNIIASLRSEFNGNNTVVDKGIEYFFSNPEVDGSGKIQFNISKGLVQKSETSTKMVLDMQMNKSENGIKKVANQRDITISSNILELMKYSRPMIAEK